MPLIRQCVLSVFVKTTKYKAFYKSFTILGTRIKLSLTFLLTTNKKLIKSNLKMDLVKKN